MKYSFFYLVGFLFFMACKKKEDATAFIPFKIKVPLFLLDTTPKKPVLILDAGHGGEDPGAVNDSLKLYEKNITRAIVNEMVKYIDTSKVTVIQTRIGDQTTDRHLRIANANKYNPNLFLTIHINETRDTTINGFEISYSDTMLQNVTVNGDSIKIANPYEKSILKYAAILNNNVAKAFPLMRKRNIFARKDDIWVIYAGHYPSILVEFGFINNRNDLKYLTDKKSIQKLAKALSAGIYSIFKI